MKVLLQQQQSETEKCTTGFKENYLFPKRIRSLAVVAAIGRSKNDQPIGVTEHSRCVQSFEDLLQQYDSEVLFCSGGEKTQLALNTLYM